MCFLCGTTGGAEGDKFSPSLLVLAASLVKTLVPPLLSALSREGGADGPLAQ